MGAEPGKQTRKNADDDHYGKIKRKRGGAGEKHRHGHLAQGMGNGTQTARHPELLMGEDFPQQDCHQNCQGTAGGGVENG